MQTQSSLNAYTAHPDFVSELATELRNADLSILAQVGRLFIAEGPALQPLWSHNNLYSLERRSFESVSQAQKILREQLRFWHMHPGQAFRRASLIQDGLPKWKIKPLEFLGAWPTLPLGHWTLSDEHTLWFSNQCSSPFPDGEIRFHENKEDPPSRAYLKLWEFFTRHQISPKPDDTCLDLGSAPGGWTWVLDQLKTNVISVDKAALELKKPSSRVQKIATDAFALKPDSVPHVDWLFSDLICYPERLLELVNLWRKSGRVKNFVCTIKFQGATDYGTLDRFRAIPGSKIEHLWHNKHEVTWSLLDKNA